MSMFEVMTPENSQHITLNDNAGIAPTEAVLTGLDPRCTTFAVFSYAKRHGIAVDRVGYAARPVKQGEV